MLWFAGAPTADELGKVRTRKPAPPVLSVEMGDGSVVPLWCTFSTQQVRPVADAALLTCLQRATRDAVFLCKLSGAWLLRW
jgi:hypothetical protein